MKTKKRLMTPGRSAFTAILVILIICPAVMAQTPKKVLLIPFTVFAGDDLAYLQKGIGQMLASRLTQEDKVEVIQGDPALAKDPKRKDKARAMGADYLVNGSLTMLGQSVSTDAKVVDLQQGKQVLSFSRVGKDQAVIIDHVDQLAAEINRKLFARQAETDTLRPAATPVPTDKNPDPSIYQHPEKLIKQAEESGSVAGMTAGGGSDASLMMRGRRVKFQMRGVATGDVDGDGRNDIVTIGPSSVTAYRVDRQQLVKMADKKARLGNYVGVDAVDVDGNGKAEIFITTFDKVDSRVISFVLEWDGKDLIRVADKLPWYFRAIDVPNRGKVLAGQRQGVDEPFASTIHEIGRKGGSYAPVERLPLPRGMNIYGFAYGNIRSPHDTDIVAYNKGGFVRILNPRGEEEWITSERYGGSHLFVEFPSPTDRSDRVYTYLSPRIHLYDLDKDGLQEIFVVQNKNIAGAFDRVRIFKNGQLQALKWDDLGMTTQWRTRNLAKYLSDFAVDDVDGDGNPEVVASVVQKSGNAFSKAHSYLAVFHLGKSARPEQIEKSQ